MKNLTALLDRYVVPPLTALSENTCMSAIRAGMVSIVPLTDVDRTVGSGWKPGDNV